MPGTGPRNPRTYERVNVDGMLQVFEAARRQGVERVVWTSSIVTLGPTPPGVVGDEEMPRMTDKFYTEYEESKTRAERKALQWATEGFPVVIVNPTRVYGPGHLTEGNALARLIDDYDRGRVPVLLNRGVNVGNYVLVDDVVAGHLLAMEKGRVGQRYILGGENASLREFFRTIDRVTGKRHFQLPIWRFTPLAFAAWQKLRGVVRHLPHDHARLGADFCRGLGLPQRQGGSRTGLSAHKPGRRNSANLRLAAATARGQVMKPWQPILDALRGEQRKPTIILFLSSPLLLFWKYFCTPDLCSALLAATRTADQAAFVGAVGHFVSCLIFLGVLPALGVKFFFGERLRDYGVGWGIPPQVLQATLILGPAFALAGYLSAADPALREKFPINPCAGQSAAIFVLHAATYLAYYAGWEFYFRGFLLFGLRGSVGDANAVLIQVLASSLLHIGSPPAETFGAILGGLLWGIMALRTKSLIPGLIQHFLLGISLDFALCFS